MTCVINSECMSIDAERACVRFPTSRRARGRLPSSPLPRETGVTVAPTPPPA